MTCLRLTGLSGAVDVWILKANPDWLTGCMLILVDKAAKPSRDSLKKTPSAEAPTALRRSAESTIWTTAWRATELKRLETKSHAWKCLRDPIPTVCV